MRIIGLSPYQIFSGFETSFFESVTAQGASVQRAEIEAPVFKLWCTLKSFHPTLKKWGLRRDLAYHTSIAAFKHKSRIAQKAVMQMQGDADLIFQIGSLWNPTNEEITLPFFMQVSYTSILSRKRNSEWKREEGRVQDFWIEQEKILYNRATRVMTTTENARRSIIEDYGISSDKVVAVGGGVTHPYDDLQPHRFPKYDSRKMFFVGKGFIGKGLDTILEAFAEVRKQVPDAELTIVGPTNEDFKGEGINYLGRIADRNQVREMYYDHALFVMPSRFEPLGQVFIEAMSCQLPCIGSTRDAMPELIDHGKTGYLIEPGDSAALAGHMIEILTKPDLAEAMGRAAYTKLASRYTWPIVGKTIYDIFRESIA